MSKVRFVELKELGVDVDTFDKIYRMGEEDGKVDMIDEIRDKLLNHLTNAYEYPSKDFENAIYGIVNDAMIDVKKILLEQLKENKNNG